MKPIVYHCRNCDHYWMPRKPGRPGRCPKCDSTYWDKPRYSELAEAREEEKVS